MVINMNMGFKTLGDLFKKLKPALYSKVVELRRCGLQYIKEEDIFNYLIENDWKDNDNMSISELTNDILYVDNDLISSYVLNKLEKTKRDIRKDKENLL